ncbi:glycosyltransferase family 2 protein [Zhouia amylolytica]|uniref:Putative glycosyltransferase n=1 Tax=Zhouia amylolytica AD3 TaxID=1286632 RepID=W2UQJ0_9FLAO|nr:glycosyltransferase family 2 protein [Zhouia amylolytica]ETN95587.1 putative glycosyltransferase [Zhouia amylolytica AD3]
MNKQLEIAIVILNWNGRSLLEQFIPNVLKYSDNATVYVADNASEDDSVEYLRQNYPEVGIVMNKENGGFAKGYNDALKHINADVYCLLNSDVEVTKNWLTPIRSFFENDKKIAIAQPKILDFKNKSMLEYAGAAGGFLDMFGYPFCRGRVFQTLEMDQGQYNDIKDIFWATGACMFIRKHVFDSLKGFDEDYFAHQEEIDLCWRANNLGYKTKYIGTSSVYHVGGATLNNMNPKKTFLNFRNSLYSLTKNLPLKKVIPLVLIRLVLDGVAAMRFLFQFKFQHLFAIFKAHLSYYWNLRKMSKKRQQLDEYKKYYVCTSIVWSYFVRKRKHYSSLVKD